MFFSYSVVFFKFLMFLILYIQFPGFLLSDLLLHRRLSWSTRMLGSFFLGFTAMAIFYYIESVLHIPYLLMAAGPVLSFIGFYHWIKKGKLSFFNVGERVRPTFFILFAIIFVVSTLAVPCAYANAVAGPTTQVYHDYLFHIGNIASLSRSFINDDIRVAGVVFYYHYFNELLFAMCKHLYNMDAFTLFMSCNALVCAWPMSLALITFGEKLRGGREFSEWKYFRYCAATLTCCVGMMQVTVAYARGLSSWMNNHLFTNISSINSAVVCLILILDILIDAWTYEFSAKTAGALFLLMVAATGYKGTTGMLLLAITISVFIVELLITKHFDKQKLLYWLVMLVAFLLTYALVVSGIGTESSNNRAMSISPVGTLVASAGSQFVSKFLGWNFMKMPWTAVDIVICGIAVVGPLFLAFVAFAVYKFRTLIKTGEIGHIGDWFAIGLILIGDIGFCSITIYGFSQGYLILTCAPLVCYCALRYFELKRSKLVNFVIVASFILGTLLVAWDTSYYIYHSYNQQKVYSMDAEGRADLVSADLMDGYFYLRDATDENSVVAVDIFSEELDNAKIYFYCSTFGERQCFIEGYTYSNISEETTESLLNTNEEFFSEDAVVAEKALEENGINYLVVTKRGHSDYQALSERLSLVFNNNEVSIYKFD